MKRRARLLVTAAVAALALVGAYRIGIDVLAARGVANDETRASTRAAESAASRANAAVTDRADARAAADAVVDARRLLAVEPLHGNAFATVADAEMRTDTATILHRIAVRRVPRAIAPRVWLVNDALHGARFDEALQHIDVLLRLSPPYRAYLYPRLMELSRHPAFAAALVRRLQAEPMWRAEFVQTLLSASEPAAAALLDALAQQNALHTDERERWMNSLLAHGRWGEAYARWVASLPRRIANLPAVYNGDFEQTPTSTGFDWHRVDGAGVELEIAESAGTRGPAAHAVFRGRPAAGVNLEHPILLAPGRYRLVARVQLRALQGEVGVAWSITCGERSHMLASGPPMLGSFDWRSTTLDFDVPDRDCDGQWLQLVNPAPAGAAQQLSGDVWFDDVRVSALAASSGAPLATLRTTPGAVLLLRGADFAATAADARLHAGERVLVIAGGASQIVFDDGCMQSLTRAGLYTVDATACAASAASASSESRGAARREPARLILEVLPQAEAWSALPIGR